MSASQPAPGAEFVFTFTRAGDWELRTPGDYTLADLPMLRRIIDAVESTADSSASVLP